MGEGGFASLNNFANIKAVTMRLERQIVLQNISFNANLCRLMTWLLRNDYQMAAILDPPYWISEFSTKFSKAPK